jgi:hypothetical protein
LHERIRAGRKLSNCATRNLKFRPLPGRRAADKLNKR